MEIYPALDAGFFHDLSRVFQLRGRRRFHLQARPLFRLDSVFCVFSDRHPERRHASSFRGRDADPLVHAAANDQRHIDPDVHAAVLRHGRQPPACADRALHLLFHRAAAGGASHFPEPAADEYVYRQQDCGLVLRDAAAGDLRRAADHADRAPADVHLDGQAFTVLPAALGLRPLPVFAVRRKKGGEDPE